jgi:hypothetical protein
MSWLTDTSWQDGLLDKMFDGVASSKQHAYFQSLLGERGLQGREQRAKNLAFDGENADTS